MRRTSLKLIIFIGLLIPYLYIFPRWIDWNQNTRFDLVAAMVERGTLSIDSYVHNTGDIAIFNQHAYSDKAPGLSFLAFPIYTLTRPVISLKPITQWVAALGRSPAAATTINRPVDQIPDSDFVFAANMTLATWLIVALPSAALGVVLFLFLGQFGFSQRVRVSAIFIYGLATPAFTYSAAFYGHQLSAVMLFAAFVWLNKHRTRTPGKIKSVALGILLGFTIIIELPTAPLVALLGLYAIWIFRQPKPIVWIAIGGLIPLTLMGLYNNAIFGSPFVVAYQYLAKPLWRDRFSSGVLSIDYFRPEALWGLTSSMYRGLFFVSPILIAAVPGYYFIARRSKIKAEWLVSLAIVLSLLLIYSSSIEWYGGYAAGPRYLVPMLPFLVWPLAATFSKIATLHGARRSVLGLITAALALTSIVFVWSLTVGGQYYAPEEFLNPLVEYSWPRLLAGDVARNFGMFFGLQGATSLIPLVIVVGLFWGRAWHLAKDAHSSASGV